MFPHTHSNTHTLTRIFTWLSFDWKMYDMDLRSPTLGLHFSCFSVTSLVDVPLRLCVCVCEIHTDHKHFSGFIKNYGHFFVRKRFLHVTPLINHIYLFQIHWISIMKFDKLIWKLFLWCTPPTPSHRFATKLLPSARWYVNLKVEMKKNLCGCANEKRKLSKLQAICLHQQN